MNTELNFIECESVDDANKIDMDVYCLVCYSDSKNRYIFKRRKGK